MYTTRVYYTMFFIFALLMSWLSKWHIVLGILQLPLPHMQAVSIKKNLCSLIFL